MRKTLIGSLLVVTALLTNDHTFGAELKLFADDSYRKEAEFIRKHYSNDFANQDIQSKITLGPIAFEEAIKERDSVPVIALYISSADYWRIKAHQATPTRKNVSAYFTNVDPLIAVTLANLLAPNGRKVIPTTDMNPYWQTQTAETYLRSKGVTVSLVLPGDTKHMLRLMNTYDVLIAYEDSSLFNKATIKPIISSLYRRKKFMVGHSNDLTIAGALASVHADKESYLSYSMRFILDQAKRSTSSVKYSGFNITVNQVLAKALGYYPDELNEEKIKLALDGKHRNE